MNEEKEKEAREFSDGLTLNELRAVAEFNERFLNPLIQELKKSLEALKDSQL